MKADFSVLSPSRRCIAAKIGLALLGTVVSMTVALADDVETFYKGKSIELVVASTAGGGYDALARAYSRHLSRHLPGAPAIVVRNLPGGGGLTAANYLYNNAPRDGTSFAAVLQGVPFQPLFGEKQARYDATKFSWIGNANSETGLFFVWHTSKVQTIQDAFSIEVPAAATDGGSTTAFTYRLLNKLIGTRIKIVTGYPGSNESVLALENGEVDGFFALWSTVKAKGNLVRDQLIRILVQIANDKNPALPTVPMASDYIKSDFDRQVFSFAVAPATLGRPFVAPPGLPQDRLLALQKGFLDTTKDPLFLKDVESLGLEADNPMSGPEALARMLGYAATAPDVIAKVAELTKGGQ